MLMGPYNTKQYFQTFQYNNGPYSIFSDLPITGIFLYPLLPPQSPPEVYLWLWSHTLPSNCLTGPGRRGSWCGQWWSVAERPLVGHTDCLHCRGSCQGVALHLFLPCTESVTEQEIFICPKHATKPNIYLPHRCKKNIMCPKDPTKQNI